MTGQERQYLNDSKEIGFGNDERRFIHGNF